LLSQVMHQSGLHSSGAPARESQLPVKENICLSNLTR